jgi:flagellar FliJ protein
MAKYTFRLQTLLKLRDSLRDERRQALARAYRQEEILLRRRRQIEDELGQLHDATREAAGPGQVDLGQLLDARRYEGILRGRAQLAEQEQKALSGEIARRREALVQADREVRVLESLRDRQRQRHRFEGERQEIKTLDDVTHARFGLDREKASREKETDSHG